MLEKSESLMPKRVSESFIQMAEELRLELEGVLGEDGVLIYPSHPSVAVNHCVPLLFPFNFSYTAIFNVLYFPVTQCPVGLGKAGLPLGIQLVAANNNDCLTLAVAMEIEGLCGGWDGLFKQKQSALNIDR